MNPALLNIEKCVIGAMLAGLPVSEAASHCSPEMMLTTDDRKIFEIMIDLDEEGVAISYITVAARIAGLQSHEDPAAYTAACVAAFKKTKDFNLRHFAGEIRDAFVRRSLLDLSAEITKQAGKNVSTPKIQSNAEIALQEFGSMLTQKHDFGMAEIVGQTIDQASTAYQHKGSTIGIPWPLRGLYAAADGNMTWGNFHGLLADSASGKTSLALLILRHAAENGVPGLLISFEQDGVQCSRQMSAQRCRIESKRISRGEISTQEFERFSADQALLANLPLDIVTASGWTAKRIDARQRQFYRKRGRGLVIIDHLKSMILREGDGLAGALNEGMQTLRDGFRTTGNAGLLLQQRRSDSWERPNPEPLKSDCYGRDAGHEALDLMLAMWRPEQIYRYKLPNASEFGRGDKLSEKERYEAEIIKHAGKAKVLCLKNRYGDENARSELEWEPRFTNFTDCEIVRSVSNVDIGALPF